MKSSTINGLLTLTGVLENTWDISALSVLLCICSIWAAIYRRSVYSGFNSRVSHTITSWMIFQFNQIASPLWPVSGKIEDNEWMIGSSPLANVAYTLRMHDVIVWFFFFLPLPLGKWNKLLRLVESGLPWGFTFNNTPSSGTVTRPSMLLTHTDCKIKMAEQYTSSLLITIVGWLWEYSCGVDGCSEVLWFCCFVTLLRLKPCLEFCWDST